MQTPRISIVIPCYNQSIFLPETLDSVLAMKYDEWECIIVNDGSPDDTSEVARQYMSVDSRFKLIEKGNGGLSSARNAGIRAASGEFILPLDSDDVIGPKYVSTALRRFDSYPETKLVYCRAKFFGEKNSYWNLPKYNWNTFIFENCIFCSCIFRKSDYIRTKGYDETMKHGFEDWDFLLKLLTPDAVVYQIPRIMFYYRARGSSMTNSISHKNWELLAKEIIDRHEDIYSRFIYEKMAIVKIHSGAKIKKEWNIDRILSWPGRVIKKYRVKYCLYR